MDIVTDVNAGAYTTSSNIVLQRALFHGLGVYNIENARIHGRSVATNTVPSCAYRGFGAPQGLFGIEMHMAHLAKKLGRDEVEFKKATSKRPEI